MRLFSNINVAGLKLKREALEAELCRPELVSNQTRYREVSREHAFFRRITDLFARYEKVCADMDGHEALLAGSEPGGDEEFLALVRDELEGLKKEQAELESAIKVCLVPKDANSGKDVILEIRAGTGGDEAALFAAELFRMYSRYCEQQGWKMESMSSTPTGIGGIKEVIVSVAGDEAYVKLKHESGAHRVQRVPETEASGRVHTSAVTVAVLPEAEEVDLVIEPQDIRVDVYRSSGCGGQSVNTTDSAVRITHIPTGMVVTCQDEKSQHKNKAKALRILRSRVLDKIRSEHDSEIANARKLQVGTGDRSEKIRTYNFPQSRVTDHRIGLTLYNLADVMEGNIDVLIGPLLEWEYSQSSDRSNAMLGVEEKTAAAGKK